MHSISTVAVTIPIYKSSPTTNELMVYNNALNVLSRYDIILYVPEGLNLDAYDTTPSNVHVIEFPKKYLSSREAYSALMINPKFYRKFTSYDYILTYQLDAWVFEDQLLDWCNKGYHYIGAPWKVPVNMIRVGNGGLALRHVSKSLEVLDVIQSYRESTELKDDFLTNLPNDKIRKICWSIIEHNPDLEQYWLPFSEDGLRAEDSYWAHMSEYFVSDFNIPTAAIASQFSVESEPSVWYGINNTLPFGCHSWEVIEPTFWKSFIPTPKKMITNILVNTQVSNKMKTIFYKNGNSEATKIIDNIKPYITNVKVKPTDMGDMFQIVTDDNQVVQGEDARNMLNSIITIQSTSNNYSNKKKTKLKILVTALYVNGWAIEGGSSFYMKCIIDNLKLLGHEVYATGKPETMMNQHFDLIICSHNRILNQIKHHPAPKICISQGIIGEELLVEGADLYYSVSEEARLVNLDKGITSTVIGQPIDLQPILPINDTLKNILIITNNATKTDDPFKCIKAKYNVRMSDKAIPIEDQIKWADLCITLGRGALSSMSMGRPVLVADNRGYIGKVGDGYTTKDKIAEMAKNNFSGRRYRHKITDKWLFNELSKYDPSHSKIVHDYVSNSNDASTFVKRMLNESKHLTNYTEKLNVYGLLRIRNESKIIKDTLDHMSTFCKGIFVYDDCSDDDTAEICKNHPSVVKIQVGETWSPDRLDEEFRNRQAVLDLARNTVESDSWFIYMDADERIVMDWDEFHRNQSGFDIVTMRLWDFYITEEDKNISYNDRIWIGPEYRDIQFMFRNHPELKYWFPDQRECTSPKHYTNTKMGSVKHYGKGIDIEEWESTCDYYIKYFPCYSEKWKARKGKAIHSKSDFGRDLIKWDERNIKGIKL